MSMADYAKRLNQTVIIVSVLLAVGISFALVGVLALLEGYSNGSYLLVLGMILLGADWFLNWRR